MQLMSKTIRQAIERTNWNTDTSFGNRLYRWAQSYYVSCATKYQYKIVLQMEYWPELIFLNLPNTVVRPIKKFLDVDDIEDKCNLLSEKELKEVLIDKQLDHFLSKDHWYLDQWHVIDSFYDVRDRKLAPKKLNPYKLISFKQKEIDEYLKNTFGNFVGIHIRRYQGIHLRPGDLEDMDINLRNDYLKEYRPCVNDNYPYIKDQIFFDIIEKIQELKPNQKIYISTDLPTKYYSHYKKRYNNLYDKYDFIDEFVNLFKNHYDPKIVESFKKVVITDLLDFFALARTKLIFKSWRSTWGRIAEKMYDSESIMLPLHNIDCRMKMRNLNDLLVDR